MNLPNRVWCKEMIHLFQEYDHKRKELMNNGIDHFDNEEINEFILNIDTNLLKGLEENENEYGESWNIEITTFIGFLILIFHLPTT